MTSSRKQALPMGKTQTLLAEDGEVAMDPFYTNGSWLTRAMRTKCYESKDSTYVYHRMQKASQAMRTMLRSECSRTRNNRSLVCMRHKGNIG